jgi:hypothetical protein
MNFCKWLAFISLLFLLQNVYAAAAPEIQSVTESADPLVFNYGDETIDITATVTDADGDVDTVILNISSPVSGQYEMTDIGGNQYRYTYSPIFVKTYTYSIWANDSTGNITVSSNYDFSVRWVEVVPIGVRIAPSCCVSFDFFYVPNFVLQEQEILFLVIIGNCGNVAENETTTFWIENSDADVLYGPISDPEVEIDAFEDDDFYTIWNSNAYPEGTYYAHGLSNFSSTSYYETNSYVWSALSSSANCTAVVNDTSTCTTGRGTNCFNVYGQNHTATTTSLADNVTVSGMNNGTDAHYGLVEMGGWNYTAYIFNMTICDEYCCACVVNGTLANESVTNQTTRCGYELAYGGTDNDIIYVDSDTYMTYEINANGNRALFRDLYPACTSSRIIRYCAVNETSDNATCSEYYECYGSLEVVRDFEIITQFGDITEPEPAPEPEPEPAPTPTPSPTPEPYPVIRPITSPTPEPMEGEPGAGEEAGKTQIKITIRPMEPTVTGYQEEFIPVVFEVENIGDVNVTNVTLFQIIGGDWDKQDAKVDFIAVGETLERTLFIYPTYKVAAPSIYIIPVQALDEKGIILDTNYYWVNVLQGPHLARIEIIENPTSISLPSDSTQDIPILVRNTGKMPLHGVTVKLENVENCVSDQRYDTTALEADEEGSFTLTVTTKTGPKKCDALLIVGSDERAYSFAPMAMEVQMPQPLIPFELPVLLLLSLLFTLVLLAMVLGRKRERFKKLLWRLMIVTIAMIIVYALLEYFAAVPSL